MDVWTLIGKFVQKEYQIVGEIWTVIGCIGTDSASYVIVCNCSFRSIFHAAEFQKS